MPPTVVKLEEAKIFETSSLSTHLIAIDKHTMRSVKVWLPTSCVFKRGNEIHVPQWLADKKRLYYLELGAL